MRSATCHAQAERRRWSNAKHVSCSDASAAEARDSLDDFPTPPWATRALIEHVIGDKLPLVNMVRLESACGVGHMGKVLREYFAEVRCSDVHDYGYGEVCDYLALPYETNSCDWVITNPPFRLGEQFVLRSLKVARKGVAILARTVFIESVGRYENIFHHTPPTKFAQFTERVPMVKGRLDKKASTATGYGWLVWEKNEPSVPRLMRVPSWRASPLWGSVVDIEPINRNVQLCASSGHGGLMTPGEGSPQARGRLRCFDVASTSLCSVAPFPFPSF